MRIQLGLITVLCALAPHHLLAAEGLWSANLTVGQNLQTSAVVSLVGDAPDHDMALTVTSNDPGKLLLALSPADAGAASIVVPWKSGFSRSPDFCVQALSDSGVATYTASAPGYGTVNSTVTFSPSGVVIGGPFGLKTPSFQTTTGAVPATITVYSVRLDADLAPVETQPIAGGRSVNVSISSSDPQVGRLASAALVIAAGALSATTEFQPTGPGDTSLRVSAPALKTPASLTAVTAKVIMPGMIIATDITIGKDLQIADIVGLGQPAPAGGLAVTLTSSDPKRLMLSAKETEAGSGSITLTIPAGGGQATYYLQALQDSGTVTYSASAPGYRTRTATVTLAPSGLLIMPELLGPPDEGEVLKPKVAAPPHQITTDPSPGHAVRLAIFAAYLDPVFHRGADITVQPLRGGVELTIVLENSNPAVGSVTSPLVMKPGSAAVPSQFTPLAEGSTVISVTPPAGFVASSNATVLKATVRH
jgi:hypothetical protein